MNAVDKLNLFTMLRSELTDTERQDTYPKDNVQEWSERKRKDYYDRLAAILKDIILKKNLKVKFR